MHLLGKVILVRLHLLEMAKDHVRLCKAYKDVEIPSFTTQPPEPWWGKAEDQSLLLGIKKHGYGKYDLIRADPELSFHDREYSTIKEDDPKGKTPSKRGRGRGGNKGQKDDESSVTEVCSENP